MIQALRNGEVDFADGLKPQLVASVEDIPNVTLQHVVSDWWLNLAFNFGGQGPEADPLPALHDITVRHAIAMAIDKQAIADKVYQGTAAPGDTIIRPASAFWHLDIPAEDELAYDPGAATSMLEEAGYVDSDGDGVREDPETGEPLELLVPASQDTGGAVEAGELIVGYLEQIGIQVELRPVSDGKMNDYWGAGNFDAYIWYWSGDPDPNYQLFVFTSDQCGAWSDGCWQDPTFDALYEEQRKTFDREADRRSCSTRSDGSTSRPPASCSPIPGRCRPTGTTASPGGCRTRETTATCCPATTTTRWSPFGRSTIRWPPRRAARAASLAGSGW